MFISGVSITNNFDKMSENPNNIETSGDESNKFETREEYLNKLNQWLNEARLWHAYCATLPYYVNLQNQTNAVNSFVGPTTSATPRPNNRNQNEIPGTYEFVIPPLWKRLMAELVDFLILLLIKMIFTFFVIESFYIVSVENYRFDTFRKNVQDPKIAMQMSFEILTLELLHRFIVCCYEVYWLKGGQCATPGKRYMGLMVVKVNSSTIVRMPNNVNETVRVQNCTPLGLQKAIIRAVLKNLFLGVMLPMCFTLYIFPYNRTGYDTISNSLVVEYNPNVQFQPVQ